MTIIGHDEKGRFITGHNYGGDRGSPGRPEIYTEEWLEEELNEMVKWMSKESNLYFKRFCADRGYAPQRLNEAIEKYPRFASIKEMINTVQECKWVEGGAKKKLSEGICKMMLINMGAITQQATTVIIKRDDPVAIAVNDASGTSKDLVSNDT